MPYRAPVRDQMFVLKDVLGLDDYSGLPGFADASMEVVEQILEEAAEVLRRGAGAAERGRRQGGLHLAPDNTVKTPTGFKEAYRQMVDGGWPACGPTRTTAARACPVSCRPPSPR